MSTRPTPLRVLGVLALAPATFLIAIVVLTAATGRRAATAVPELLLITQLLLAALLAWAVRRDRMTAADLGWRTHGRVGTDLALGAALGGALAFAYLVVIEPALAAAQRLTGDIVPPGEMLVSFQGSLPAFLIANVILAPLVEETLYRGYALPPLRARWGTTRGVLVASLLFGALHWAGGLWYMAATAIVVGVPFALLAVARRGVIAAYTAHLALNVVEFVAVAIR